LLFTTLNALKHFYPQQSQLPAFLSSTDTAFSQEQLPNTSLFIPFTNTIVMPQAHHNLLPAIGDFIEANIKSNGRYLKQVLK